MRAVLAEKIPSWLERVLLPRVSEITGELKAVNSHIDGMEKRIDKLENSLEAFRGATMTRDELLPRFEALHTRLDAIEKRIPVIEKLAEIEVRPTQVEKKLSP